MSDHPPGWVPPWMDSATLAEHICASPNTIDTWVLKGILPPPRKRGGKLMWKWAEVKDALRGNVYFVRSGDFIKIGFSFSPKQRIANLTSSSAHGVRVLLITHGSQAHEKRLHKQFDHLRDHGEWFRAEPELLAFIERLQP